VTLLLDVGNSRLKWAWFKQGVLQEPGVLLHRGRELAPLLQEAWAGLGKPAHLLGACVAPAAVREQLERWVATHWGCAVRWARSEAAFGQVRNGYRDPARLGVDRWLAICAAWQRLGSAACVIDCGSAITIDILDKNGAHQGGLIAPGLRLMGNALASATGLPETTGTVRTALGRDTAAAIESGASHALLGLIERARGLAPPQARLALTGGDAGLLAAQLDCPYELLPDLVLEGLAATLAGG
jgi:type III pantothenate kinase